MLVKSLLWIVLFPITVIGFFIMTLVECVSFIFNSPVDVWDLISKSVDEATSES
jgi:hypothetical protein